MPERAQVTVRPVRWVLRATTLLIALATCAVTLGPWALVLAGREWMAGVLDSHPHLDDLVMSAGGLQTAGNELLFVPLAALVALILPLRATPPVGVLVLAAPLLVETLQRGIPGRVADGADLVQNTTGLAIAFGVVLVLRLVARAPAALLRRRRPGG